MVVDEFLQLKRQVYLSHAVHNNMQGHTGGAMSFGWGLVHKKVPNQKLNSKSTMVYQVVRVTEYIPYKTYILSIL